MRNFRIARLNKTGAAAVSRQVKKAACRRVAVVISGPGGHPEQMRLLFELVPAMGEIGGAVVAIQTLPPFFSEPFARYVSERCGCPAAAIRERTNLYAGHCYVGIHGCPLKFDAFEGGTIIDPWQVGNGLIPVERLLKSTASVFGRRSAVVLLSGADTGDQTGIRAVRDRGGRIFVRDHRTSLVAGPLEKVINAGLADEEIKPESLVKAILNGFEKNGP